MIRLNLFMIWFLHFLSLLSVICRCYRQNSSSRIIVVLVYTVSMLIYYYRGLLSASTFGGPSEAVTNLLAVITTIIVFLLGRYFFLRAGASEEKSAKKLYFSEFEDLLRHINANLKVMVQLQYELDQSNEDCSVASVHLKNLQWPEKSCLFSDVSLR